ncbi:MAG: helix-turn-helix transcriptional regulator, partial [Planctomycetaceae bacterium]
MPLGDRIPRLLRLVELLQSGRAHNSAQIATAMKVSRRTVFRDIRTLESSGVPVLFDEQRQGYSIRSSTLLPTADLSLAETLSLLVVCHEIGDRSRGVPFQQAARSAALKLLSSLPHNIRECAGEWTEMISLRLDPRNSLEGFESSCSLLTRALAERRLVRINYGSLDEGKVISTALSPYRLLFSRRSWYVIG